LLAAEANAWLAHCGFSASDLHGEDEEEIEDEGGGDDDEANRGD
jgi:hypothetical protein